MSHFITKLLVPRPRSLIEAKFHNILDWTVASRGFKIHAEHLSYFVMFVNIHVCWMTSCAKYGSFALRWLMKFLVIQDNVPTSNFVWLWYKLHTCLFHEHLDYIYFIGLCISYKLSDCTHHNDVLLWFNFWKAVQFEYRLQKIVLSTTQMRTLL